GEARERRRRERQPPRRVERSHRADSSKKAPLLVERTDDTMAGTRVVVMLRSVLQGVGYVDFVPEGLDVKRREARGGVRVNEIPGQGRRAGIPLHHVDRPGTEVRRQ